VDDILSQTEIDDLIKAMGSGEVQPEQMSATSRGKVKNYDFKRPNKFSKDHINTLHNIHENYCRSLASNLSANLQSVVDTSLISIEQVTYLEFIHSLPNPTFLCVCDLAPLGIVLFDVNPGLAFTMVDLLLGGQGDQEESARNLTQIERLIVENRVKDMIGMLPEAWANILPLTATLSSIDTNPQFVQGIGATEMVALITIEVKPGNRAGFIHICLPFVMLEPILPKLTTQVWFTTNRYIDSNAKEQIRRKLDKVRLEVKANLGTATLNVRDLLNLVVGDVLPLGKKLSDPVEVIVGSDSKFLGIPGTSGGRVAIQLTDRVNKGDEANE